MLHEHLVPAESFTCLLDRNSQVEIVPEPFRLQSSVAFRLAYSEYANYIISLGSNNRVRLSADYKRLLDLADKKSPLLYKYYLQDVAFAIVKELCFAQAYNCDATIILPTSDTDAVSISDMVKHYDIAKSIEDTFIREVQSFGFDCKIPKSEHNLLLYKLAVVLYYLAPHLKPQKAVSILYDVNF